MMLNIATVWSYLGQDGLGIGSAIKVQQTSSGNEIWPYLPYTLKVLARFVPCREKWGKFIFIYFAKSLDK